MRTWFKPFFDCPVMSRVAPNLYLISLCTIAQEANESFGLAIRIGTSDPKFNIETTKVIHSILTFSPAPDSMAVEFLNELNKVSGISYLGELSHFIPTRFCSSRSQTVEPILHHTPQSDPANWATGIMNFLSTNFTMEERSKELQPVTNLASKMLSYLLIASMALYLLTDLH